MRKRKLWPYDYFRRKKKKPKTEETRRNMTKKVIKVELPIAVDCIHRSKDPEEDPELVPMDLEIDDPGVPAYNAKCPKCGCEVYRGRKFPTTNKYECPTCGAPLHKYDGQVVGELYFCCQCSRYCYVELERRHT